MKTLKRTGDLAHCESPESNPQCLPPQKRTQGEATWRQAEAAWPCQGAPGRPAEARLFLKPYLQPPSLPSSLQEKWTHHPSSTSPLDPTQSCLPGRAGGCPLLQAASPPGPHLSAPNPLLCPFSRHFVSAHVVGATGQPVTPRRYSEAPDHRPTHAVLLRHSPSCPLHPFQSSTATHDGLFHLWANTPSSRML